MKTLNSILIFTVLIAAAVYAVSFSGCSDTLTNTGTGTTKTYQARTEKDFADRNLKAEPGAVIVVNLEDLHGKLDPEEFDTDLIGVDIIPYRYTETAEHKISIGDSSYFAISLINENTKRVMYELNPTNNHATVTIPAGDYLLVITSLEEFGADSTGSQVVFIQPDMEESLNRGGGQGQTDYNPGLIRQLIRTKNCWRCNFFNADLSNLNLIGADLRQANLSHAHLRKTNLSFANLTGANITSSDLSEARLTELKGENADFSGSTLYKTDFSWAYLKKANFFHVYGSYSKFSEARLFEANMQEADLSYAKLGFGLFYDTKLKNAIMNYADLGSAIFSRANLTYAKLDWAVSFYGTKIYDSNCSYASFGRANLTGVIFQNSAFVGARMISANLSGASMVGEQNFTDADLSYANVTGVSFCRVNKTGMITTGAIIGHQTYCFP